MQLPIKGIIKVAATGADKGTEAADKLLDTVADTLDVLKAADAWFKSADKSAGERLNKAGTSASTTSVGFEDLFTVFDRELSSLPSLVFTISIMYCCMYCKGDSICKLYI